MKGLARLAPAAVAAILLTAGIVTLALLTTHDDESPFVHLQGVPKSLGDGSQGETIELAPAGSSPAISSDRALSVPSPIHDRKVRQVVLVKLVNKLNEPPVEHLAWALNYEPGIISGSCGPAGGVCPSPGIGYGFALIDANTGDFIEASEGPLSSD